MIIFRCFRIFPIFAVLVIYSAVNAHALVIFFNGQLDYIQYDKGGVYSGTAINTDFVGGIDDDDTNGYISDGSTSTSFGCCIAAGGLSVTNDMALSAEDVAFLNGAAGSVQYAEGDVVDVINIEGDKTTDSGGRIEIGISYILPSDSFDNEDPSNYPIDQNKIELAFFFIYEEDDSGNDLYSAGGKIIASSSSAEAEFAVTVTDPELTATVMPSYDGNPTYWTFGWRFTANTKMTVKSLGMYDWGEVPDGLMNPHEVGLWTDDGTLLTSVHFNAGDGLLFGRFRYLPVREVVLYSGQTYRIGATYVDNSIDRLDIDVFPIDDHVFNPALTRESAASTSSVNIDPGLTFPSNIGEFGQGPGTPNWSILGPSFQLIVFHETNTKTMPWIPLLLFN